MPSGPCFPGMCDYVRERVRRPPTELRDSLGQNQRHRLDGVLWVAHEHARTLRCHRRGVVRAGRPLESGLQDAAAARVRVFKRTALPHGGL